MLLGDNISLGALMEQEHLLVRMMLGYMAATSRW